MTLTMSFFERGDFANSFNFGQKKSSSVISFQRQLENPDCGLAMFASKAGAYPSGAPFICSTPIKAPGLSN